MKGISGEEWSKEEEGSSRENAEGSTNSPALLGANSELDVEGIGLDAFHEYGGS